MGGLNFGGLGFSFSGEDDGATEAADSVGDAITRVGNKFQKFGDSIKKTKDQLAQHWGKIKDAGMRAGQGVSLAVASAIESATNPKLSNAFESQFLGFKKNYKAMTIGMDMTAKESKKMERVIGSVAFGLNEDMDAAAQSWVAFRKDNIDLTKVLGSKGTKGAVSDLIKVTQTFGIEGQQLANVTNNLIHSFGFTEERVGKLGDTVYTAGKQFGIGKEAVQAWPSIMETLNKELADFGRKATPEDIEKLTASVVMLGGAFKEMGGDPAASIQTAQSVLTSLMGERRGIQDMFRGMGGDVSEFGQRIMESTGSADAYMKLISEDPARFIGEIAKAAKQMQAQGGTNNVMFQRLNKTINETLGPDVAYAIQGNWDQVAQKMETVGASLTDPKIKGSMVQAARDSHVVMRTAQESWDLMMQSMEARLMRISGPLRRKWVKDMKGGFNSTIGVIEQMAAEKGPIGELTQRLLLVKDVGLSALVPALGKLSPLLGGLATSMLPVMTAFGAMGLRMGAFGKMALAGGALYGVFYLMEHGPDKAIEALKNLGKTIWTFVSKLFPEFAKKFQPFIDNVKNLGFGEAISRWFEKIDWERLKNKLEYGTKMIWGWIQKIPWGRIFEGLASAVGGIGKAIASMDWTGIFRVIGNVFSKIPWTKIFDSVFDVAKALLVGASNIIRGFLAGINWKEVALTASTGIFNLAGNLIETLMVALGSLFFANDVYEATKDPLKAGLSSAFMSAVYAAKDIVIGVWTGIWKDIFSAESFGQGVGRFVKILGLGLGAAMLVSKKFRFSMLENLKAIRAGFISESALWGSSMRGGVSMLGRGISAAGGMIKGVLKSIGSFAKVGLFFGLLEALNQIAIRSKNIADINNNELIPSFNKASLAGEEGFMGILDTADSVFMGIPSMIGSMLGLTRESVSNLFHGIVGGWEILATNIIDTAKFMGTSIGIVLAWVKDKALAGWEVIKTGAKALFAWLGYEFLNVSGKITEFLSPITNKLREVFLTMQQNMEITMTEIVSFIAKKVVSLSNIPGISKLLPTGIVEWAKTSERNLAATGGVPAIVRRHELEQKALREKFKVEAEGRKSAIEQAKEKADEADEDYKRAKWDSTRGKSVLKELEDNRVAIRDRNTEMKESIIRSTEETKAMRGNLEVAKKAADDKREYMSTLSDQEKADIETFKKNRGIKKELTIEEMKDISERQKYLRGLTEEQIKVLKRLAKKKKINLSEVGAEGMQKMLDFAETGKGKGKGKGAGGAGNTGPGGQAAASALVESGLFTKGVSPNVNVVVTVEAKGDLAKNLKVGRSVQGRVA